MILLKLLICSQQDSILLNALLSKIEIGRRKPFTKIPKIFMIGAPKQIRLVRPRSECQQKMSFSNMARRGTGTIGRKLLQVPPYRAFPSHQPPPTSKKSGPKEDHIRLLRNINRKKNFHAELGKHFKALATHFKAQELSHTEKAKCHERKLQDYAWRYEKEVQHDEMLKEMLIKLV